MGGDEGIHGGRMPGVFRAERGVHMVDLVGREGESVCWRERRGAEGWCILLIDLSDLLPYRPHIAKFRLILSPSLSLLIIQCPARSSRSRPA